MPRVEPPFRSAYPDDFIDSLANLAASVMQEQLAPILRTLHKHAELIEMHTALLNHSTEMNRYNVGKIEDIRDFQNNINYKFQRFVHPEDRYYPKYQTHPDPTAGSLPRDTSDTTNPSATENDAESPERLPPSPAVTVRADSRPSTPRQQQGDGFSVVPGPSRRLQRERPFSVEPDPMWNSIREINPYMRLAIPAPPPPYVPPPAYTDSGSRAPRVEPQTSSSQTVQRTSPAPAPPVRPPSASSEEEKEVEEEEEVVASLSSRVAGERRRSPPSSPLSTGTVASDAEDAEAPTRLSEKARGKKRMRDEDYHEADDDYGNDNALAEGSGGGRPSSWSHRVQGNGDGPRGEGEGSSSSSRDPISGSGGRRDRDHDRDWNCKRQKRDHDKEEEGTTTNFNLDRIEIDDQIVSIFVAFGGASSPRPGIVRRRHAEKLKTMQKMFCGGRDSH